MSAVQQMLAAGGVLYKLGSVTVNTSGTYTGTPSISFSGGGNGSGASAYANMAYQSGGGQVPGSGYVYSFGVNTAGLYSASSGTIGTSGGGGSGATGNLTMSLSSSYVVAGIVIQTGGVWGWTTNSIPALTFSAPDGTGGFSQQATGTVAYDFGGDAGRLSKIVGDWFSGSNGGSCHYSVPPTATVTGGGGSGATIDVILTNGDNVGWGFTNGASGTGYTSFPTVVISGGTKTSGPDFAINLDASNCQRSIRITGANMSSYGLGYSRVNPYNTIKAYIGGQELSGHFYALYIDAYSVTNASLTANGSGYTSIPTAVISAGTQYAAASITPYVGYSYYPTYYGVSSITVNGQGSGYTQAPQVSFTGGDGSGASATANMVIQ